jgi:hypothetical protein
VDSAARGVTAVGIRVERAAVGILLVGVLAFSLSGCSDDGSGGEGAKVGDRTLAVKEAKSGSVDVKLSPRRISAREAVFDVTLDTHSGDLGVDLDEAATLSVAGTVWPTVAYQGDGPGGHHREGTIRFRGAGPVAGPVRLIVKGLERPVMFTWLRAAEAP